MSKRSTLIAAFTVAAAAGFTAIAAETETRGDREEVPVEESPTPVPPLDLAALLREAEANNPEIAALRLRHEAAGFLPGIAEVPPDPVATVSYLNDTVTGFTLGQSEFTTLTFGWTQEVPYPGKLHLTGEVARREVEMVRSRLDAARLGVAAGIKGAFVDLYRIDRSASILIERRNLLVSLMQTARVRYETGDGILENVLKAQSEITRLDLEIERLKQQRLSASATLNTMAGRSEDRPLAEATALPVAAQEIDPRALEAEALARSPELHEREAAVLRDEGRLDLARRQLKPDLIWGAAYSNRGGLPPMVMGTFGLRLPIYRERKQVQAIAQVQSETDASKQEVFAARLKVAALVRDLAARASRAEILARLYREGLIPQAESALDSASAAYVVGRADFLTLLNDFSTVLTYEIDFEAQRSDRVAALAALEPLTGRELVTAKEGAAAPDGGRHE